MYDEIITGVPHTDTRLRARVVSDGGILITNGVEEIELGIKDEFDLYLANDCSLHNGEFAYIADDYLYDTRGEEYNIRDIRFIGKK